MNNYVISEESILSESALTIDLGSSGHWFSDEAITIGDDWTNLLAVG